jgi:heme/copper-type cytochrome/quinol oxidase subunit 2
MLISEASAASAVGSTSSWGAFMFLPILIFIIYLLLIGFGIYCMILFIKLATRGIKALDIYIAEKKENKSKEI